MEKECLFCKSKFSKPVYVSKANWNTRRFCSHACVHSYEIQQTAEKIKKDPKVCKVCGKTYYRNPDTCSPSQWKRTSHCSRACGNKSFGMAGATYNKSKVKDMGTKNCVICGKEFTRANRRGYKAWKEQITCGNECAIAYRAKQPFKSSRRFGTMSRGQCYANRKMIVFARDDFTCQMCGFKEPLIMQVDHKIEKATDPTLTKTLSNLWTLCPNCHARKTALSKSKLGNTTQHIENLIPRVKFLQDNPEYLKELLEKN